MEYMANATTGVSIDPALFFVPEDVIDVRAYTEPNDGISSEPAPDLGDSNDVSDGVNPGDASNPDSSNSLQTPQWLQVVEQKVRIASDGRAVVDVTIEVEDVAGAEDYELRVTKV